MKKNKNKKGFSLIELLISMIFIGSILSVGVISYNDYIEDKIKQTNKSLVSFSTLFNNLKKDLNSYKNISYGSNPDNEWIEFTVDNNCKIYYNVDLNTEYLERYLDCNDLTKLKYNVNHFFMPNIKGLTYLNEGNNVHKINIINSDSENKLYNSIIRIDLAEYSITEVINY